MSILITTVVSVFIFGLVVMIHELGHFICAKKAGIQVNEFPSAWDLRCSAG